LTSVTESAIALFRQGRLAEALSLLDRAVADNPADPAPLALKAQMLKAARRFEEALACFEVALKHKHANAMQQVEILNEHGALLSDMKRHDDAIASYDRALAIRPDAVTLWYNRGNALRDLKREQEALESYDRALALKRDFFQALNNRGSALHSLKRHAEAVESFDRALAMEPRLAETWNNRGISLAALERRQDALESYDRALALEPNLARAWDNRGSLLRDMARPLEALAAHDKALAIDPSSADAWFNRGNVLRDQRRLDEALESYDRALALDPGNPRAWTNRGIVLRDLKRIPDALASYGRALAVNPDHVEALYSRGIAAWVENHDCDLARGDLERAVGLDPNCPYALGGLLLVKQYGGDWRDFDTDVARIDESVRSEREVTEPFVYQAVSSSPQDLQTCSVIHARHRYPAQTPIAPRRPTDGGKIRIGYVSGEFREQATAYLMAGVYEHHDKTRFEIAAYDNGGPDQSPMRQRLEAAFDRWVDISVLSDREAARRIAADGMDILVNLNGYFGDHRMGVFAERPAPIQVNYLGFPATLGAPYMDYILADRIVIPDGERRFYTEQVVWLPHSYQANDSRRAMPDAAPSRSHAGLPETGFVFCNFNASYKLTPATFASLMRILKQVPGSVLWLLEGLPQFARHLRAEAERQGVDGARIIFAPMAPLEAHLARLRLADLFLDGLPYNAHTTASDALWAGVPLITLRGSAFPGRVAASLLHAIGLPELVTENTRDFEALAVKLAREPASLTALRDTLARNRLTAPLFDTARFTGYLERAFETMLARSRAGEKPAHFAIGSTPRAGGDNP
jgi:predicted O-linked N-acetylglucosamine transferase (SPINDLY family)